VAALTGEPLDVVAGTTMMDLKQQIAREAKTLSYNVVFIEKSWGVVDETRHSFASEVLVYINSGLRGPPPIPPLSF